MKEIYIIYYNAQHNPHITKYQNEVRNIASRTAKGKEETKKIIEELTSKGHTIKSIYNGIGNKVTI